MKMNIWDEPPVLEERRRYIRDHEAAELTEEEYDYKRLLALTDRDGYARRGLNRLDLTILSIPRLIDAIRYAVSAHDGQWRKGGPEGKGPPYVVHCLEVTSLVARLGQCYDVDVLCAAVLHDVIEDTPTTDDDIVSEFGPRVAELVAVLTLPEECRDDHHEKKHVWQLASVDRMDRDARLIKVADKASNVEDLVRWPPPWVLSSIIGYAKKASEIVQKIQNDTSVMLPQPLLDEFWKRYYRVMDNVGSLVERR